MTWLSQNRRLPVLVVAAVALAGALIARALTGRPDAAALLQSAEAGDRARGIRMLAGNGDRDTAEMVARHVTDRDPHVAILSYQVLRMSASTEALDTVRRSVGAEMRPGVRASGIATLAALCPTPGKPARQDVEFLTGVLTDEALDDRQRAAAARALGQIGSFDSLKTFLDLLDRPEVSCELAHGIGAGMGRLLEYRYGYDPTAPASERRRWARRQRAQFDVDSGNEAEELQRRSFTSWLAYKRLKFRRRYGKD